MMKKTQEGENKKTPLNLRKILLQFKLNCSKNNHDNFAIFIVSDLESLGVDTLQKLFKKTLAKALAWCGFIPNSKSSDISSNKADKDVLHT